MDQDTIIKGHATLGWDVKETFFASAHFDDNHLLVVKQAHEAARNSDTLHPELDAFMQTSPETWSPATNDRFISLWMVSGDIKYLNHLKDNVMQCKDLTVPLSAAWALKSLSEAYQLGIEL
jgi:hypothetical protein